MMKKILLTTMICIAALTLGAQTQQGYVKTPGRLGSNGKVIPGKRLQGATVQVKGRSAVVSGTNGTFSFPIPANKFFVQGVKKQGYVLTDPEATKRQYTYSSNPIILVMDTQSQQIDNKLANERKIRRALQRQLLNKEEEIEVLKEQNRITKDEYQKKLQLLYSEQENNEKLISDMAERYSQIDFDQMDEFNLRVSDCILNGRLTEADSLLRSKGNIYTRIAELNQHHKANEQAQATLDKSKAMEQKKRDDIAQDCYNYFQKFYIEHKNDSAAHYLELRANLDTTNVDWQIIAGIFINDYFADYQLARSFLLRGLRNSIELYGEESENVVACYLNLGSTYDRQGNYEMALGYYQKALVIGEKVLGRDHHAVSTAYNNIGLVYFNLSDYSNALNYYSKALEINEQTLGTQHQSTASAYNNIGLVYKALENYSKSLDYFFKALEVFVKTLGPENPKVSTAYSNIASVYSELGQYSQSLEYNLKALSIDKKIMGDQHPNIASCYTNIGAVYSKMGEYSKALEYYSKALPICEQKKGKQHPSTATLQSNIGMVYDHLGEYQKALEHLFVSLNIYEQTLGQEHVSTAIVYNNIGWVYKKTGQYAEALNYLTKALNVFEKKLGQNHTYSKIARNAINDIKQQMKN